MSLAMSVPTATGCLAVDIEGRVLPLRATRVAAHAEAGHARVRVEQTFTNPYDEPLDVTYTLPLPADGAVAGFRFRLDAEEVSGEVHPRSRARERYEDAVLEGRTAALLEEERSSVFTQRVGNLPPHATLVCVVEVDQPLVWEGEGWTWRFPTVVGPRYRGADGPRPVVVEVAADATPDATLEVSLHIADPCVGPATSPSHRLEGTSEVTVAGALDRDVVVRWPVARETPGVEVSVARHGSEGYAAVTVVPPLGLVRSQPRHLVVLLDTSGSMGGRPLEQARELVSALIETLQERDHLELLAFASQVERFSDGPVSMDRRGREAALSWLLARRASGGTEMTTGIRAAVAGRGVDGAQKQVVLVTDGYIGFETEIVGIALDERDADTRVHTVGVGSAVNRSLTEPVARAGGGVEVVLGLDEAVAPAVRTITARTTAPLVTDLELAGGCVLGTCHRLPDLYGGAPVTLYAQVAPEGGEAVLRGRGPDGAWEQRVVCPPATREGAAAQRWARDQVADLELLCAAGRRVEEREGRIERLGVDFAISTRLTSWVATTRARTVDPDRGSRTETQPQALPYGVSAEGVGLRRSGFDGRRLMAAPVQASFGAKGEGGAMPGAPSRNRMASAPVASLHDEEPGGRKEKARKPMAPPPAPFDAVPEEPLKVNRGLPWRLLLLLALLVAALVALLWLGGVFG